MRAWRWYRDEEVQRPNKPWQQTKLRRLRVAAVLPPCSVAVELTPSFTLGEVSEITPSLDDSYRSPLYRTNLDSTLPLTRSVAKIAPHNPNVRFLGPALSPPGILSPSTWHWT